MATAIANDHHVSLVVYTLLIIFGGNLLTNKIFHGQVSLIKRRLVGASVLHLTHGPNDSRFQDPGLKDSNASIGSPTLLYLFLHPSRIFWSHRDYVKSLKSYPIQNILQKVWAAAAVPQKLQKTCEPKTPKRLRLFLVLTFADSAAAKGAERQECSIDERLNRPCLCCKMDCWYGMTEQYEDLPGFIPIDSNAERLKRKREIAERENSDPERKTEQKENDGCARRNHGLHSTNL